MPKIIDADIQLPILVERIEPNPIIVPKPMLISKTSSSIEVEQTFQCDVDYYGGVGIEQNGAVDAKLVKNPNTMTATLTGLSVDTEYTIKGVGLPILGNETISEGLVVRTKASPIPSQYQLVEWLESTGASYIETNVQATNQLTTHIEFELLYMPGTGGIFNDREDYIGYGMSFYAGGYSVPAGGQYDRTGLGFTIGDYDIFYNINGDAHNVRVNGIVYGDTSIANQLYTVKLFYRTTRIHCKFKHCEFIDMVSGDVIADIYPVYLKSNYQVNGGYDIIRNVFLQGSSPFYLGPNKEWEE